MGCLSYLFNWWGDGIGALEKQLKSTFGIEMVHMPGHKPTCMEDLINNSKMRTADNWSMEELMAATQYNEQELMEAQEIYTYLEEMEFSGGMLAYQLLSRSAISPEIVRVLCTSMKQQEEINFPVLMEIIATFDHGTPAERLSFIFSMFDYDGSGTLTDQEIYGIVSLSGSNSYTEKEIDSMVEEIVSELDRNDDGEIGFIEFIEAFPRFCAILGIGWEEEETQDPMAGSARGIRIFNEEGDELAASLKMVHKKMNEPDPSETTVASLEDCITPKTMTSGTSSKKTETRVEFFEEISVITPRSLTRSSNSSVNSLSRVSGKSKSTNSIHEFKSTRSFYLHSPTCKSLVLKKDLISPAERNSFQRNAAGLRSQRTSSGLVLGGAATVINCILGAHDSPDSELLEPAYNRTFTALTAQTAHSERSERTDDAIDVLDYSSDSDDLQESRKKSIRSVLAESGYGHHPTPHQLHDAWTR